MTWDLIYNITKRNLTGGQAPCETGLKFLRYAAILLLLMVCRVSEMWAATKDFDLPNGYYYLGNHADNNGVDPFDVDNFEANFYMCPAYSNTVDDKNYLGSDGTKPLITTFKSFSDNTKNKGKTYSWAVWYIEAATGDNTGFFYIRHRDTGQYLVANDNTSPKSNRRRVNLGPTTKPKADGSEGDGLFKIQSDDNGVTYYISSKTKSDGGNKYVNPSKGNLDYLAATSDNDKTGGILGFWSEKTTNSAWHFVQVPCDTPVITYNNNNNEVTITGMEGASFYYTTNGTVPDPSDTGGDKPTMVYDPNSKPTVTSSTTIQAVATLTGYAKSPTASAKLVLNPTITLASSTYTYTGSAIMPAVSSVMDGETPIDASEYTVSYNNNINAGNSATVNIVDKEGGDYIVYGSTTFTINPANVTLTANSDTKAYDGTEKTINGFTCSVEGLTFAGVTASGSGTNIGEYPVTFTGVTIGTTKDTSRNYVVNETVNGTLTITPKPLTITADSETKVYDGTALTKNSYTSEGLMTGDVIEGVTITGSQTNAGSSDNVPSAAIVKKGNEVVTDNYNIIYNNGTLTITPKTLTVTAEAKSKAYGEADPALTYTSVGLINDDAITGALTRDAGENAGDYAILQGTLTAGNNYAISYTAANLTITKVGLTITANNNTITYGEAPAGNGVTYEGLVNNETGSVLSGTLAYDYNYTQYGEVGNTYTITPKGVTSSNYDITFADGILTVNPKEVGLTWSETTSFPYDGSPHAPTVSATGKVNDDAITVTVTGAQTNAGEHTATASALTGDKAGNYVLPEEKTKTFTITSKSIGNGTTLADGYTLDFGEGNTILLTDDAIGSTLVASTDYTVGDDTSDSDKYSQRTVTGAGNYSGSVNVRNAKVSLTTDASEEGWSATFTAEAADPSDIGHALPEGVMAFIITGIRGEWAIPEPLTYIPAGVPVLLVASKKLNGFIPMDAESGEVTPVTDAQKGNNMLEEVTETTTGYDAGTQSAPFTTKQIYLLYNNEFVFNKAGNLKKGKIYLNPSHTAPANSNPAPARLRIAWSQAAGIQNLQDDRTISIEDGVWYTIDGRRLNGKPSAKGLYIVDGKKTVVK